MRPVSILDILPTRLASVYTFYNPDYRHMEWGKYTALREIYWTQQVRQWGTGRAVLCSSLGHRACRSLPYTPAV